MRRTLFFTAVLFTAFAVGCNKSNSTLPIPVPNPNPYVNEWAGTYDGSYTEMNNGVDSNGVFKNDTTYTYSLKIEDAGNYMISIIHGPVVIPAIAVDSTGYFIFYDYNRTIKGQFVGDSLNISSKALNGAYNPDPSKEWFVIQTLNFIGKKQ